MSADRIKVKRDGPRGWHWIAASSFDPARHEVITDAPAPAAEQSQAAAQEDAPAPAARGRGRRSKPASA